MKAYVSPLNDTLQPQVKGAFITKSYKSRETLFRYGIHPYISNGNFRVEIHNSENIYGSPDKVETILNDIQNYNSYKITFRKEGKYTTINCKVFKHGRELKQEEFQAEVPVTPYFINSLSAWAQLLYDTDSEQTFGTLFKQLDSKTSYCSLGLLTQFLEKENWVKKYFWRSLLYREDLIRALHIDDTISDRNCRNFQIIFARLNDGFHYNFTQMSWAVRAVTDALTKNNETLWFGNKI